MAEPEPELLTPAPAVEAVEAKIGECVLTDAFPVSFELALDEVTATAKGGELEAPRPYIGHISRQAYLPLVFKQLREHFADSMPPQCGGDMWCSTGDGTPLKWHRPSGVLFDLHGSPDVLPWRLIVHFSKFPQDQVRQVSSWWFVRPAVLLRWRLCCNSCSVRAKRTMSSSTS